MVGRIIEEHTPQKEYPTPKIACYLIYRCNRCGLEWNRKIEQIKNNKANEDYLIGVPKKC